MSNARSISRDNQTRQFWRWFMVCSILVILVASSVSAWRLGSFLEHRMLEQDVTVSMQFVNSIVRVQGASAYFHGDTMSSSTPEMEEFFRHVASLPDVIRANVYGSDRTVLWSSMPSIIGQRFADNHELDDAFAGKLAPEIKSYTVGMKAEHVDFPPGVTEFIEHYLPIWHPDRRQVIGAVEIYKNPTSLLNAIREGQQFVWAASIAAALALTLGLAIVVRYARRLLRAREAETVEMERLAVVGEMASAVAHGLRNPLAAIRSCAELALEDELPDDTRQSIRDIISQSDRLEGWIRSFLNRTRQGTAPEAAVPIDGIIQECLGGFSAQLSARSITADFAPTDQSPLVQVPRNELHQVMNSILSNSIEAIQHDGKLRIRRASDEHGMICVTVVDSGPGIPQPILDKAFQAFETTKSSGLGVGLALAKRIVERIGGNIELGNSSDAGAEVRILIPAARA